MVKILLYILYIGVFRLDMCNLIEINYVYCFIRILRLIRILIVN